MPGAFIAELLNPRPAPLVIAHRGASAIAPENTLPAFDAAWATGCGWVEADVQPTYDNVPVMLHDEDLDRTTNGTGPVRHRTAPEVAALDAGSWFPGRSSTGAPEYGRTPVPFLAEVLDTLTPHRSLLLEIKGDHTREQVLAAMAVVKASGWDDRVFLQSFEPEVLLHVRSVEPGRPIGLLVEALHEDPVAVCADLGAAAYNPQHQELRERPAVVADLHAAGIAVLAWTADDKPDWAFLTQLRVDGIITNRPAELIAWQAETHSADRALQLSSES